MLASPLELARAAGYRFDMAQSVESQLLTHPGMIAARVAAMADVPLPPHSPKLAKQFADLSFELAATSGTANVLEKAGLKVQRILKLLEGRPNVIDLLKNNEIQLVINTPSGAVPREDGIKIRTTAIYTGTPIITTLSGAKAAVLGIAALKKSGYGVKTLQEYH